MRGKRTPAEVTADAETAEAEQFIKRVRRVSRRHFSAEEKVRVVLEGFRREVRVSDLCRREGITPNVYYSWLKDFMEAGKLRLQGDTARDATQVEKACEQLFMDNAVGEASGKSFACRVFRAYGFQQLCASAPPSGLC